MFYDKKSIDTTFEPLLQKLEKMDLFIFEPMPSYKLNERWTDEHRIRDGHTKLEDGSWVTIHNAANYLNSIKTIVTGLYDSQKTILKELSQVKKQKFEMEYGLRVARKSLEKSLSVGEGSDE